MQHNSADASCGAARPAPTVRLVWDQSKASARHARAWVQRLGIVDREHSQWGRYLRLLYGDDMRLPLDVRTLRWFWWWAPGSANVTRTELPVWRDAALSSVWVPGLRMERHLAQAGFFVTPEQDDAQAAAAAAAAATSGGRLEVMRVSHPAGESTRSAFGPEAAAHDQVWYWNAPGSGIYLSVGRTLAVANRSALLGELTARLNTEKKPSSSPLPLAMKHVRVTHERGLRLCDGCSASTGETYRDFAVIWWRPPPPQHQPQQQQQQRQSEELRVCDLVRRAGFDTIQLTRAFGGQRFEVIDCRERGGPAIAGARAEANGACAPRGSPLTLASGAACACNPTLSFLNCGGGSTSPKAKSTNEEHNGRAWCVEPATVVRTPH